MKAYPHHLESVVRVNATPTALFAELDDHDRLVSHMMRSSAMMAGSTMAFTYDENGGRAIGSKISMSGRMLGLDLNAVEAVTEREPPFRKSWETIGEPRLLVIGGYRMGFEIAPEAGHSNLRMFIDYEDAPPPWRWLGRLLGRFYANWCVRSMADGAAATFSGRQDAEPARLEGTNPTTNGCGGPDDDKGCCNPIEEALRESYPASDPPAWTLGEEPAGAPKGGCGCGAKPADDGAARPGAALAPAERGAAAPRQEASPPQRALQG